MYFYSSIELCFNAVVIKSRCDPISHRKHKVNFRAGTNSRIVSFSLDKIFDATVGNGHNFPEWQRQCTYFMVFPQLYYISEAI
jgi:predicted alpha/beta hydrolase family esterase